ncbi:flavin reductase family protein [Ramlibacter tataouinensis]|uniref:flavin reductase family protein n=1 Tax=Ramlibacter tataouinensis TaxID=94132 RepID=UPI0022F3B692|nr:flavin reductase family protein [Ramlibacter tataouinensis]WBY00530.1 flavin reductase family protein [Ramlibacter tataouinensis]
MRILGADLEPLQAYKLLTGVVVPRPIAWVTSRSPEGVLNLAPFSTFTYVSTKPPMVGFNVGRRAGHRKDTANNILANGEFVVHVVDETLLAAMHESSEEHPPEVSEAELLGLEWTASERISVPRLVSPRVAMECRLHQAIPFGDTGAEFLVGEVLVFHVQDRFIADGKIDSAALNPVCRLAGPRYATLGPVKTLRSVAQTPQKSIKAREEESR